MTPFTQHTGITAPLVRDNINTDTIIPSREMRSVSRSGLSEGLFAPWRYHDPNARTLNSEFVLNEAGFSGASILLTGANFGCGSSREHAVWAFLESGFRVIIATSFATIFRNNALRNGLLTIELHSDRIEQLAEWVSRDPQAHTLDVDLEACTIRYDPHRDVETFSVDPNARDMLLRGLDEIGLTEQSLDEITAFEKRDQERRPWVYLGID
jgi:3-isopropylmalate/(R)-2-methylmalate dehydratase small subunit